MAINPIAFARTVNEQFLRYQLMAFPLTDEPLARQAEESIREAQGDVGCAGPSRRFPVGDLRIDG